MLEHGGRVSKYPRGGGPGAGVDRARVRRPGTDVRPSSYFNNNNKALLPASASAAVRFCAAADIGGGSSVAAVVPGPRKFVGPTTGGG